MRMNALTILTIVSVGCGASTTSPTSPTRLGSISAYEGAWTGATRRQECIEPGGGTQCNNILTLSFLDLTLTPNSASTQLQGLLRTSFGAFIVLGGTDASGALTLTGQASAGGLTSNLTRSEFRVSGSALTGTFTFTSYQSSPALEPPIVTAALESVFKTGTPEAAQPPPTESRFAIQVLEGLVFRYGQPATTEYTFTARISNTTRVGGRMSLTGTPIGPDGTEYAPVQQPLPLSASFSPLFVGTTITLVKDFNFQRPIATSYRLRVEYQYDDGVTGTAEGVAAVKIRP